MNPFDERLDRALSSNSDDVAAEPALGDDLIRRGRARRRRKVAVLGAVSTVAVALAGIAVVTSIDDDPGAIATDPGTTVSVDTTDAIVVVPPTSATPTTVAVTTDSAPETSEPEPVLVTTPGAATTSTTSTSTTTTTMTTTTPLDEPERPVGVEPVIGSSSIAIDGLSVEFGRTGEVPDRDVSFFVSADDLFEPSRYELWSPGGRAATMQLDGCDSRHDCGFSVSAFAYDGGALWAVVEHRETVQTAVTQQAFVLRADLVTGTIAQAYTPPPLHAVPELTVTDDARILVWEVAPVSTGERLARVLELWPGAEPTVIGEHWVVVDTVTSAVLRSDGRAVAYASAFAREGRGWIHAVDLDDGTIISLDLQDATPYYPIAIDWAGEKILLGDGWEDAGYGIVDPTGSLPEALSTLGQSSIYDTEAACVFANGTIARSTWQIPYAEGSYVTGDIEFLDVEGTTIAPYGVDIVSNAIACLDPARVAVAEYPSDDPGDFESPRRLSIITLEGVGTSTTQVLAEGNYAILRP